MFFNIRFGRAVTKLGLLDVGLSHELIASSGNRHKKMGFTPIQAAIRAYANFMPDVIRRHPLETSVINLLAQEQIFQWVDQGKVSLDFATQAMEEIQKAYPEEGEN